MHIKRNIRWDIILRHSWKKLLFFIVWATTCFGSYYFLGWDTMDIAFEPLSIIGIAVAFYISFKNSQSYDRFWEARKIWGGIVNYSRTWTNQVLNIPEDIHLMKKTLVYRHIAWVNALRVQLRKPNQFTKKENAFLKKLHDKHDERHIDLFEVIREFLPTEEIKDLTNRKNVCTHIIKQQARDIKKLFDAKAISEFDKQIFHRTLEEIYNLQGGCERIKNTPFPRQYAYFSTIFKWIFILLLPLALLNIYELQIDKILPEDRLLFLIEMIPLSVLISWIFSTMESIGSNSEDPFEGRMHDVPLTSLCRTIEIDLKDMLDEDELPEKIKPKDNILY